MQPINPFKVEFADDWIVRQPHGAIYRVTTALHAWALVSEDLHYLLEEPQVTHRSRRYTREETKAAAIKEGLVPDIDNLDTYDLHAERMERVERAKKRGQRRP